jgi:inositol hexakisphosphate/diphosphoinositol-pentakisphosphate kinase
MDKKVNSKAMNEVIKRLIASEDFDIIVFGDSCIIDRPPEEWPICEALISFTSGGFPLDKAIQYVNLRKPFLINDLEAQKILFDRTKVYEVLKKAGVPIPRFAVVWRERGKPLSATLEEDDAVIINGERFNKPFVEKPVDAEDHYICIYYPRSAGGGCTQLFRKVGNKSSEFFPTRTTIRKDRSYLYEEFLATEGTDVKVYSCGENYAHAEARKSPAVDGRVQRDGEGKEIRYPVMLTKQEKWISQQVNRAFKQGVCGFDLLRANGESFVCDVNGWSFVKGNQK